MTQTLDDGRDVDPPSRFPWPPVLLGAAVAFSLAFDRWIVPLPIPFAEILVFRLAGVLLLAGGIGFVAWAALAFREHGTTIRPDRAADSLITTGAFALSRNPVYLGEVLALLGGSLVFNRLSLAVMVPVFAMAIVRLAIRGEETHLERRFGERYLDYCDRVRRWL